MGRIMSPAIRDFLVPSSMAFLSFPHCIAQAKISGKTLNRNDRSRYPSLVPDYKERIFVPLPLGRISALGFFFLFVFCF